jgi:hypothetical protein
MFGELPRASRLKTDSREAGKCRADPNVHIAAFIANTITQIYTMFLDGADPDTWHTSACAVMSCSSAMRTGA